MTEDKCRRYIRYAVVRIDDNFELEEVISGLVFRSQAVTLAQKLYWSGDRSIAVVSENVSNGMEEERADSIHECQTERILCEDEKGTYWRCPACDGVCPTATGDKP